MYMHFSSKFPNEEEVYAPQSIQILSIYMMFIYDEKELGALFFCNFSCYSLDNALVS